MPKVYRWQIIIEGTITAVENDDTGRPETKDELQKALLSNVYFDRDSSIDVTMEPFVNIFKKENA